MSINLLDDVAPASNELGAIADMAQQMYDLQTEIIQAYFDFLVPKPSVVIPLY